MSGIMRLIILKEVFKMSNVERKINELKCILNDLVAEEGISLTCDKVLELSREIDLLLNRLTINNYL
jgi:hypothetical protein